MSQFVPPISPGPLGARPHRGGTILALGIVSLVMNVLSTLVGVAFAPCCFSGLIPIALAIPAWVMANTDLAQMNAGQMDPSGRSATSAGKTCSIISIAISTTVVIGGLLIVLGLVALAGAAGAAGRP